MSNAKSALLRIGEIARQSGVSTDTIRFYERLKLIRPSLRSSSGYRLYSPAVIDRLRFIRQAKVLSFSLEEISQIVDLSDQGDASTQGVREMIRRKVNVMDREIEQLAAVMRALHDFMEEHCEKPDKDGRMLMKLRSLIESIDIDEIDLPGLSKAILGWTHNKRALGKKRVD